MMTCPARIYGFGPWEREENLDEWKQVGKDLVCSFCGSMHPDNFFQYCKEAIDPASSVCIDKTDKQGKFYIHGHGASNATQGGIKFRNYHCIEEEWNKNVQLVTDALKISWKKMFPPPPDGTLHILNQENS